MVREAVRSQNPEEIFGMYALDGLHRSLPILTVDACRASQEYIDQNQLTDAAGLLLAEEEWSTYHTQILATLSRLAIKGRDDVKPGPYLMGGRYYQNGVSLWVPNSPKPN